MLPILLIRMKYMDILSKEKYARSLSAGDVNVYGDQNVSFDISLVCRLKSKKQLRTRNTHGTEISRTPANPEVP